MAFNFQFHSQDNFYVFIELLKKQKALPQDCFIQDLPFFKFNPISKESQVLELFNSSNNQELYQELLKDIISVPQEDQLPGSSSSSTPSQMMTFAQLCLYKVLPCSNLRCQNKPREIVTHNQYKDSEYECPFYHHERDRRRIVLNPNQEEEFIYKANYYEEGRNNDIKENYSQNYFESMFHPLYYKMFRCKREYCNKSHFCPFYHHEQEKKIWDDTFITFLKKGRITYVKDKQKYYESTSNTQHDGIFINQKNSLGNGKQQSPGFSKKKRQEISPNSQHERRNFNEANINKQIGEKINQFQSHKTKFAWMKNPTQLSNLNNATFSVFGSGKNMIINRV